MEKPCDLHAEVRSIMSGLIPYNELPEILLLSRTTLDKTAADPSSGFPTRHRHGRRFFVKEAELRAWIRRRLDFDDAA